MRIAYLDESYDKSTFWLAALICDSADIRDITNGLDATVAAAHVSYGTSLDSELHGHRLFHGVDDWAGLYPRQRISIYEQALSCVGETGATVVLRGVDILRLHRRYREPASPHVIALQHLIERIDEEAAAGGFDVLAVADEVPEGREHQQDLWVYQRESTTGYRSRQIINVLDTIYFGPSEASRLLQAADLITFLQRRIFSNVDTDPRALRENDRLWSNIVSNVVHTHCWRP